MRHELTIEIARPPKDVYVFLYDPARLVQWMDGLASCQPQQAGGPAPGQEYDIVMRQADGADAKAVMRLTEVDKNERLGFVIEGPGPLIEGHYILDASPAGTSLILTRDTVARTFGERWKARRQGKAEAETLQGDLDRLKKLVESE